MKMLHSPDNQSEISSIRQSQEIEADANKHIIQQLNDKCQKMLKMSELTLENAWIAEAKDKKYSIHKKFDENGLVYCRGESRVKCNIEKLKDFL